MPDTENNNQEDDQQNNQQAQQPTGNCVYDKYGRAPGGQTICAIGIRSASADTQDGIVKCVFKNECPHCHNNSLMWGWKWDNDPDKVAKFDGTAGTNEGHIYCVMSEGGCDADYSIEGNEHIDGSSYKLTPVSGPTPSTEEEAQQLSNGQLPCDNSTPGEANGSGGGSGVYIKDKTFYGLIKQIIGAVDAVFIIANNMAYIISFKQFYEYRNEFDEYILNLTGKEIINKGTEKWWATDGFYNAVEVTYSDGIVKYQNDALVDKYGENIFYYEFPDDDEETAKAKADALLSAHVRDYALDLKITTIYNPNITVGSWIKVPKKVTNVSGTNAKPYKKQQTLTGVVNQVRKGVNILNLTETIQELEDGHTKYIEHIKDEEDGEYDVEVEKNDYELFFVQGYSIRWTSKRAPLMDIHLKYGPDTPEDPINATVGGGSAASAASSGKWGNDTFRIEDICVADNKKILGSYSGGSQVQKVKELINGEYTPQQDDYQPRANQNSNYAKKYGKMSSPAEVYAAFRSEYKYSYYADNSSCWTSATDFYDNAGKTANCGDTTCLLKVFFDCIGVPSCGVHIDNHYFNAIQINGTWEVIDGVRIDNQTCNFPDGTGYCFGNPYPCDSYKGGNN